MLRPTMLLACVVSFGCGPNTSSQTPNGKQELTGAAEASAVRAETIGSAAPLESTAPPAPSSATSGAPVASPSSATNDRIEFRFQDASVPPPHHRSYTITATPGTIRRVVDSYGDVVSDKSKPLSESEFADLLALAGKVRSTGDTSKEPGCTGGTSRSLKVTHGQKELSGRLSRCGGTDSGTLAGDFEALVRELGRLAPSPL